MAINSSTPARTMDRSCSSSASDTSSGGGEPRTAGDKKKEKTTGSEAVCLKKLLQKAPPEYLMLSLTPSSAPAAAAYRRRKRTEEVSLAGVDAPRDYLSLSLTRYDNPKRRRGPDVSGGGGSVVADASPLVLVEAVIPPPPPVEIPAACLPPKKRIALAIVNRNDGVSVSRSSWPPGDGDRPSPATVASHPIDVVPLQAVYVHRGVSRPFRLGSSAEEITTDETAAVAGGQAKQVA